MTRKSTDALWGLVAAVCLACAGSSKSPAVADDEACERQGGATEREGIVWCGLVCNEPALGARCEGPSGRPVACQCTSGERAGSTFAVARCEVLTGEAIANHCD